MAYSELNYVDNGGGDIQVGVEQPIGTFFDGTNTYIRYRKVIDCGALPNGTDKNIPHGITYVGILNIHGVFTNNSGTWIPFEYSTTGVFAIAFVADNNIVLRTVTNMTTQVKSFVTLEYYR